MLAYDQWDRVTIELVKSFNASRKIVLQNLASYDLIAKRIRDLPTQAQPTINTNAPTSSQDRLQKAIYSRAAMYLGEKMALIKTMGSLTPDPSTFPTPERPAKGQTKDTLQEDSTLR